jgi:phosphoribosylanthranilate isomerase
MQESSARIVKICGLSMVEHALVAAEHGADLLGFVFAPSRRQVRAATVRAIHDDLDSGSHPRPPFVGVFVNPSAATLAETVGTAGLDLVQLSGDESLSLASEITVPYIRAIRIGATTNANEALREADRWMALACRPAWLLVDAAVPGSFGGSGQRANWNVARQLAQRYPTLLAGGLDPDNVAVGLAETAAAGADVSSGVEENGVKSAERIVRFIAAARRATPAR